MKELYYEQAAGYPQGWYESYYYTSNDPSALRHYVYTYPAKLEQISEYASKNGFLLKKI